MVSLFIGTIILGCGLVCLIFLSVFFLAARQQEQSALASGYHQFLIPLAGLFLMISGSIMVTNATKNIAGGLCLIAGFVGMSYWMESFYNYSPEVRRSGLEQYWFVQFCLAAAGIAAIIGISWVFLAVGGSLMIIGAAWITGIIVCFMYLATVLTSGPSRLVNSTKGYPSSKSASNKARRLIVIGSVSVFLAIIGSLATANLFITGSPIINGILVIIGGVWMMAEITTYIKVLSSAAKRSRSTKPLGSYLLDHPAHWLSTAGGIGTFLTLVGSLMVVNAITSPLAASVFLGGLYGVWLILYRGVRFYWELTRHDPRKDKEKDKPKRKRKNEELLGK
ncbi:MAG: hypothetical protein HY866_05310 [Chloroflexi bacterium]|nr:hypothetical protein [Chloroflexota bacterium]